MKSMAVMGAMSAWSMMTTALRVWTPDGTYVTLPTGVDLCTRQGNSGLAEYLEDGGYSNRFAEYRMDLYRATHELRSRLMAVHTGMYWMSTNKERMCRYKGMMQMARLRSL